MKNKPIMDPDSKQQENKAKTKKMFYGATNFHKLQFILVYHSTKKKKIDAFRCTWRFEDNLGLCLVEGSQHVSTKLRDNKVVYLVCGHHIFFGTRGRTFRVCTICTKSLDFAMRGSSFS